MKNGRDTDWFEVLMEVIDLCLVAVIVGGVLLFYYGVL